MALFTSAISYVLANEGTAYTNNPDDLGGPTKFGITLLELSAWRKTTTSPSDVENLTQQEAETIYQHNYWDAIDLNAVADQNTATCILDQAVNQGVHGASLLVQKTLILLGSHIAMDGKLGPLSFAALNSYSPKAFLIEFISVVQNSYVSHVITHPTQIAFLTGWLARSQKMMQFLA